jgi:hypothetical protein
VRKELSRRVGKLSARLGDPGPLCIRFLQVLRPDLSYADQGRWIEAAEELVLGIVERQRVRAPLVCSHAEATGIVAVDAGRQRFVVDVTGGVPVVREESRRW